jgi:hypothetical protein
MVQGIVLIPLAPKYRKIVNYHLNSRDAGGSYCQYREQREEQMYCISQMTIPGIAPEVFLRRFWYHSAFRFWYHSD